MLAETNATLTGWAFAWMVVGVAICLTVGFVVYRVTGGSWPDDECGCDDDDEPRTDYQIGDTDR